MSPMHFFKTMLVLGTVTALFVASPALADPDFDELVGKARAVDGDTLEFGFKRVDLWGRTRLNGSSDAS